MTPTKKETWNSWTRDSTNNCQAQSYFVPNWSSIDNLDNVDNAR